MTVPNWEKLAQDLAAVLGPACVTREPSLGAETTYRVGGTARVGVRLSADADFGALAAVLASQNGCLVEVLVVGKGSNMLVADTGFDGVAIWLEHGFNHINIADIQLRAGGSTSLAVLARQSAAASLTGLEWAVGVPGSLGGGVRMNAGGHGLDIAASLISAQVADLFCGRIERWDKARLNLSYRSSALGSHHLVMSAELMLDHGDAAQAQAQIAEIVAWRRKHQPGGQNAGSVFTNPSGDNAGRLIQAAGLKGFRCGSAEVSQKHANFIVADRNGSADDVYALMCEVFHQVQAKCAVALIPETKLVGFKQGPWVDQTH